MQKHVFIGLAALALVSATLVPNAPQHTTYQIEVDIGNCTLTVYRREAAEKTIVSTHSVATVKRGIGQYPTGRGTITAIEVPPYWYPTAYTRLNFAKRGIRLPAKVPPYHELNYMGDFKVRLSHNVPGKGPIYSIHGNNDPTKIGKRVTGGCIRMNNHEGLLLISEKIFRPGTRVDIIQKKGDCQGITEIRTSNKRLPCRPQATFTQGKPSDCARPGASTPSLFSPVLRIPCIPKVPYLTNEP